MDRHNDILIARKKSTGELFEAFFRLADEWNLAIEDQKNVLGEETWLTLSRRIGANSKVIVDDKTIARLVLLRSLYQRINELTPSVNTASYLRTSVPELNGETPLDVILADPDKGLVDVNKHLMLISIRSADAVFS